ncbi:hypothetical protein ACIPSE_14940 [Streptomyces sp. NPDC090106]|uniref:hypothetical protein n=1 Tax=Streptomyces sp. NPDC090106 TaxID=3365946 RepID=UPI0037F9C3B3
MPQHVPNTPVCRVCDGFASAMVTTGLRAPDGTRTTLRVDCPACHGTGKSLPASALVQSGR